MTTCHAFRALFSLVLAATAATASEAAGQETVTEPDKSGSASTAPQAAAGERQKEARPPRSRPNRLSSEELRSATQSNLFDLIRATRPRWMSQRGQGSIGGPEGVKVYIDGSLAFGLGALRDVELSRVGTAEYIDSRAATMRWGTGHPNGAIVVTSRSGK